MLPLPHYLPIMKLLLFCHWMLHNMVGNFIWNFYLCVGHLKAFVNVKSLTFWLAPYPSLVSHWFTCKCIVVTIYT